MVQPLFMMMYSSSSKPNFSKNGRIPDFGRPVQRTIFTPACAAFWIALTFSSGIFLSELSNVPSKSIAINLIIFSDLPFNFWQMPLTPVAYHT